METNQINLFKYRYSDGSYSNYWDGSSRWGRYVEELQGWKYGDDLARELTSYNYRNFYLVEVYYGR